MVGAVSEARQRRGSNEMAAAEPRVPRAVGWIRAHPLAAFVGLAYLLSWVWWIPIAMAGGTVRPGRGWPTQIPGLTGPLLAAVIVTWAVDGREGLRTLWRRITAWNVGWWWIAVAIILGAGAIGVSMSDRNVVASDLTTYSGLATNLGAFATIAVVLVVNGLGEETGWRGFAVSRLLHTHSSTATSLIVAAMWAPWHLPLFFTLQSFKTFTPVEIAGWVVGITAGSFVLTWLFRGSGGSVLLVAVWHTAFNFASGATPATEGTVAAITSTAVMVAALTIAIVDLRTTRTHTTRVPTASK